MRLECSVLVDPRVVGQHEVEALVGAHPGEDVVQVAVEAFHLLQERVQVDAPGHVQPPLAQETVVGHSGPGADRGGEAVLEAVRVRDQPIGGTTVQAQAAAQGLQVEGLAPHQVAPRPDVARGPGVEGDVEPLPLAQELPVGVAGQAGGHGVVAGPPVGVCVEHGHGEGDLIRDGALQRHRHLPGQGGKAVRGRQLGGPLSRRRVELHHGALGQGTVGPEHAEVGEPGRGAAVSAGP